MAWSNITPDLLMTVTLAADLEGGTPVKVTSRAGNSAIVDAGGGDAYCGVLYMGGKKGSAGSVAVRPGAVLPVIVDQPVTKHQLLMETGGKFCPITADAKAVAMASEDIPILSGTALAAVRLVRHRRINTAPGPLPVADQSLVATRGVEVTPLTIPPLTDRQGTLEYFERDLPEELIFNSATRTVSGTVLSGANTGSSIAWIVAIDEYGQVAETKLIITVE